MGRNKKDATQDVLNLYNQMQEDENIESGKDEIKVTLEEIESAKKVLNDAKEELGYAYRRLESTKVALMAAHRSTDNIVDGICHAIVKAEQSNLKVGINDEGLAQLDWRLLFVIHRSFDLFYERYHLTHHHNIVLGRSLQSS